MLHPQKSPLRWATYFGIFAIGFGAKSAREINRPVPQAMIKGKIKASDVLKGFFISNKITTKNILVENVVEEYKTPTLLGSLSNPKDGVPSAQ